MSRFTPYWSDVGRYADPMAIGCSCGIGKRREGTGAALKLLGDACVRLIRYIRRWVEGPSFAGPDAMDEKEISGGGYDAEEVPRTEPLQESRGHSILCDCWRVCVLPKWFVV